MRGIVAAAMLAGLLVAASALADPLRTRDVIDLWPGGVGPGSASVTVQRTITERSPLAYWPDRIVTGTTRPGLTAFVPDRPNGTVIIVAPGGAYMRIAIDKESSEMARWLNPAGVTVLLLEYRLPGEGHANGPDVPLEDAQRAVRVVRAHAEGWGLNPNRIGFLGASAGGHMGASLGAQFDKPVYQPTDAADGLSARPDFEILLYPVVSMQDGVTHMDSRDHLLGKNPTPAMIAEYSPDLHVQKTTPPTFIVVAADDSQVPPTNSLRYYAALQEAGVPSELHVFRQGDHGFGIRDARQLPVANWPNLAMTWMKSASFVP